MLSVSECEEIFQEQRKLYNVYNVKDKTMDKEQVKQKIKELQELLVNETEYNIILDRSGSMASIKSDMEGGFKTWLEKEKKLEGKATINLYQFDTEFDVVYEGKSLDEADLNLTPRGGTALNDAIGKTIGIVKDRHSKKKPDRTVFVIITDGEENSSREWTASSVKNLVEQETKQRDWMFLYIGANQDAVLTGKDRGISAGKALNYTSDHTGTKRMWDQVSIGTSNLRSCSSQNYSDMVHDKLDVFEDSK